MKIPLVMSCADGRVRARQDAAFGLNPMSNSAVTAKTAAYTITSKEYGCAFSNEGATGAVTFTLPTCFAGATLIIFKMANQTLTLDGAGSDTIDGAATLANTASQAGSAMVTLYGISATKWIAQTKGTWA